MALKSYSDECIGDWVFNQRTVGRQQRLDVQCALHRVILKLGSQAELARRLKLSRSQASTIRWWVTKGRVPAKWVHQVAEVGDISVDELVADWSNKRLTRG